MAVRAGNPKGVPKTPIGDLYEKWTLDCLTACGEVCSQIFRQNPHRFKTVPATTASSLAALGYRLGKSEVYLDQDQREWVMIPLLGRSDGRPGNETDDSAFCKAASGVRETACRFVERVYDTAEDQLRNAFRDAVITLQQYLSNIAGGVLTDAEARISPHFDQAVGILQDPTFAAGFGVAPAPPLPWPLDKTFDGDGAKIVQAITAEAAELDIGRSVSDAQFIRLQRIGFYGAITLDFTIDASLLNKKSTANSAIGFAYQWKTALDEYRQHAG